MEEALQYPRNPRTSSKITTDKMHKKIDINTIKYSNIRGYI